MSAPELTLQDIEAILQIIKAADGVTEFSLKYGSTEIYISRNRPSAATAQQSSSPGVIWNDRDEAPAPLPEARPPAPPARPATAAARELAANEIVITAPMVGTFYRSPAPLEPPFVEVGQAIEVGTVLCIIEVMKLMNSIPADRPGMVTAVLVGDGEAVEFGQPLIVLQTND